MSFERDHPGCTIYANASSGTTEYKLALGVFAYVNRNAKLITAPTREFTIGEEEYERLFYDDDGIPTGLSKLVYPPKELETPDLTRPDEVLVRSLRIYNDIMDSGKEPFSHVMAPLLKKHGLWRHDMQEGDTTPLKDLEKMNFERRYLQQWRENGWMDLEDGRKCHGLSDEGRMVIDLFYVDADKHGLR